MLHIDGGSIGVSMDFLGIGKSMPEEETIFETGDFFKLLGDSTRIKILFSLLASELCVGDMANLLGMTQSAVSHQLRVLRAGGLVKYRKDGKNVIYSLDDEHVAEILESGLTHIQHRRGE